MYSTLWQLYVCNCSHLFVFICYVLNSRNQRFGRRKEEDSHEALRCLLDGLRMEEINVRIVFKISILTSQLPVLQKIKDHIYAHFDVTKDPASHSDIDGEDKLKLKGMYVQC